MTEEKQSLKEQFKQMPRVLQWAAVAALGLVLYLVYTSVIRPQADAWNRQADAIISQVEQVHEGERIIREFRNPALMRDVVMHYGPVQTPGGGDDGASALHTLVNEVIEQHPLTDPSFDLRRGGSLKKTALPTITRGGGRVDRLVGELNFDATPQATIAIIGDLESRAEIESITRVDLTKIGAGRVRVRLTIDAWVRRGA